METVINRLSTVLISLLICSTSLSGQTGPELIIPKPQKFETGNTYYLPKTDGSDITVRIQDKSFKKLLQKEGLNQKQSEEAYQLQISDKGIVIRALTELGSYRAKQSLSYMLSVSDTLKSCTITDWPRFPYRGIMLDISRNFRDKEFILKQIDALSAVKVNYLHLHLTDDAGWRVQIDKYPRLTSYAAWRKGEDWKEWVSKGRIYLEEGSPDACGGYLSKEDVREIVDYARSKQMEIIPEIEIPGHSAEVLAAYPELACIDKEGKSNIASSDICPGNEMVYQFYETVLSEILEIFPSKYIHIGGDEAGKSSWKACPVCQAKMKEEGLSGEDELQSYCIRRIEQYLNSQGRVLIGWDEIMQGGLPPRSVVMCWRGTELGLEAMAQGHDVILSPNSHFYLDYYQDSPVISPQTNGGYIPLERIYSYNPPSDAHLLGLQANLWTEYVPTAGHAEYMLYPRAFAVAETGWSSQKDYEDFRSRAQKRAELLRAEGYNPFDLAKEFGNRPEYYVEAQHLARACKVKYNIPYENKYAAGGETALTDGKQGGWTYSDSAWQGFFSDIDVVVDLGEIKDIHYAGAWFLSNLPNWVSLPEEVEYLLSDDGEQFRTAAKISCQTDSNQEKTMFYLYGSQINDRARYVRVKATLGKQPQHGCLFTDEIVIN